MLQLADNAEQTIPFETRSIENVSQSEVVAFIHHILSSECGMRVRRQLESSVAQFFEHFDTNTHLFTAYYDNDRLCGLLGVNFRSETTAILKWIFVAQEARNKGLGSYLIDSAISFAHQTGYQRLILCTATKMEAAHYLYRKKGFVFKEDVTFWRRPMKILECDLSTACACCP